MLAKVKFSTSSHKTYDYETDLDNLKKNDCIIVETSMGENIAFFDRYILENELSFDGKLSKIIEKVDLYDKKSLERLQNLK
jgi:hypothetical protein